MNETTDVQEYGWVYVISNNSFKEGFVKVGVTKNIDERPTTLDATGVPTPFKVEFAVVVRDPNALEKRAHKALDKYRVRENREWFDCGVRKARDTVLDLADNHNEGTLKVVDEVGGAITESVQREQQVAAAAAEAARRKRAQDEAQRAYREKRREEEEKQARAKHEKAVADKEAELKAVVYKESTSSFLLLWGVVSAIAIAVGGVKGAGISLVFMPFVCAAVVGLAYKGRRDAVKQRAIEAIEAVSESQQRRLHTGAALVGRTNPLYKEPAIPVQQRAPAHITSFELPPSPPKQKMEYKPTPLEQYLLDREKEASSN